MAYVGTLTGAIGAFALNFLASPNLTGNAGPCSARGAARVLPHRAEHGVRSDVRRRLRPRAAAGRAGDRDPHHGALGKQFFETTENIDMKPVEGLRSVGASYVADRPLRRRAASAGELRQLCAAALRDQRARGDGAGLRRRGRHRAGPDGGDPQVLLFRRQRHPVLIIAS